MLHRRKPLGVIAVVVFGLLLAGCDTDAMPTTSATTSVSQPTTSEPLDATTVTATTTPATTTTSEPPPEGPRALEEFGFLEPGVYMTSEFQPTIQFSLERNYVLQFLERPTVLSFTNRMIYGNETRKYKWVDFLTLWADDPPDQVLDTFARSFGGPVVVLDLPALLAGVPADEAELMEIPAHDAYGIRVAESPDGSMIASVSWDDPVKLWDRTTGEPLGEFGGNPGDSLVNWHDFHPTLPQLMVSSPSGEIRIHTLDVDELIAIASAGLSRDMTAEECQQYFRSPCP